MKKLLFAALFAVVAIGGAFASNAKLEPNHYTEDAEEADIDCTGTDASCIVFYGSAYDSAIGTPGRALVPEDELALEKYNL